MGSTSKRPSPFKPQKPEIARMLARRAKEAFDRTDKILGLGAGRCAVCLSPNREEIDYLVLINAPLKHRQAALGELGPRWNWDRFRTHRDYHLLPLIKTEVAPVIASLRMIPFPKQGNMLEQENWYFEQAYGIYLDCIDKDNAIRALSALSMMREVGRKIEDLRIEVARPIALSEPEPPPPDSAPPLKPPRDMAAVKNAFRLSAVRKPRIMGEDDAEVG